MAIETETLYKLMIMHMLNKVEFPLTNTQISHFFLENGYIVEDTIYDNQVTYFIPVMVSLKERFIKDITELSNGKAEIKENGTKYVDIKL